MSYIIDVPCECKIGTGVEFNCLLRTPGGNDIDIYITNVCDIDNWNDDNDNNIVESITMQAGGIWYLVKAKNDTVNINTTINAIGGFPTNTLTFQISSLGNGVDLEASAAEVLDFIEQVTNPNNKYVVVITANNDVRYVYGLSKRGLRLADGTVFDSGSAFEDQNGWTVVLSGADSKLAKVLDPAVVLPLV